ncbi:MAG TPA: Hsp20/alpha crystallin family protein [Pyrinomonadaceae bacterium]|nr:Hsp20/alpha crystallin family protein [Pyrinomonadaceae bacterium]
MSNRWKPMGDLVGLQDRMNRLFEEATERRARANDAPDEQEMERADWYPPADVYENESEYVISLDLPGIERSALEIDLDDDRLSIRGVRVIEEENQRRAECPRGRFLRRFGVPSMVDQKAITAEYKDGVLRLRLPKRKEPKARRVEIKIN